jgi:hypothetical protein
MTADAWSRRERWLWSAWFGLVTVLLGAYLLAAYMNEGVLDTKILLIFIAHVLGLCTASIVCDERAHNDSGRRAL